MYDAITAGITLQRNVIAAGNQHGAVSHGYAISCTDCSGQEGGVWRGHDAYPYAIFGNFTAENRLQPIEVAAQAINGQAAIWLREAIALGAFVRQAADLIMPGGIAPQIQDSIKSQQDAVGPDEVGISILIAIGRGARVIRRQIEQQAAIPLTGEDVIVDIQIATGGEAAIQPAFIAKKDAEAEDGTRIG